MTAFTVVYACTGGASGSPVLTATTAEANITEGTITANTGVSLDNSTTAGYASVPILTVSMTSGGTTSAALAITNGIYFSITLTPDSGYQLDYTALAFNGAKGGSGSRGLAVRTSLDGYTTSLVSQDFPTTRPNWTAYNLDLTAYSAQTTATTFRVYFYTPAAFQIVDFDDFTITGDISTTGAAATRPILRRPSRGLILR